MWPLSEEDFPVYIHLHDKNNKLQSALTCLLNTTISWSITSNNVSLNSVYILERMSQLQGSFRSCQHNSVSRLHKLSCLHGLFK